MSEIKKCRKCGEEILEKEYFIRTEKEDGNCYHKGCLLDNCFTPNGGFLVKRGLGFQREEYSKNELAVIAEELFVRLRK